MAVTNMTMNYLPPSYPTPNQPMVDFDNFSAGQASFEDSETESNFTSDEFDSESVDDFRNDSFAPCPPIEPEPNIAHQLLNFAEMVNKDIQKFFGKRKAFDDIDEDVCKDRFASGKSGRELYYADLLKIAQGGRGFDSNEEPKKKSSKRIIINNCDGHQDKKLGALGDLFQFALTGSRPSAMYCNENTSETVVPWRKRTLPRSFFMEPQMERRLAQDPPDFSDLMAAAADD